MKELLLIFIAYLIGSIPTALLISRHFFGVDISEQFEKSVGVKDMVSVLQFKQGLK